MHVPTNRRAVHDDDSLKTAGEVSSVSQEDPHLGRFPSRLLGGG